MTDPKEQKKVGRPPGTAASRVWDYFTKKLVNGKAGAVCNECEREFDYQKPTCNLTKHLRVHKDLLENFKGSVAEDWDKKVVAKRHEPREINRKFSKQIKLEFQPEPTVSKNSHEYKTFLRSLAEWLTERDIDVNNASCPQFVNVISSLNPQMPPPFAYEIKQAIIRLKDDFEKEANFT